MAGEGSKALASCVALLLASSVAMFLITLACGGGILLRQLVFCCDWQFEWNSGQRWWRLRR